MDLRSKSSPMKIITTTSFIASLLEALCRFYSVSPHFHSPLTRLRSQISTLISHSIESRARKEQKKELSISILTCFEQGSDKERRKQKTLTDRRMVRCFFDSQHSD
ncbi:hypothetical protein RYX36_034788 [Vicia faba]